MEYSSTEAAVSMVTPVWNGGQTIAETIASVRSQGTACGQYMILDALSTDDTESIVQANLDLVTDYVRAKDAGLYDAMNRGVAMSRLDVVGIINADDLLTTGALGRVLEAFSDPVVDFVYSDVRIVDNESRDVGLFRAQQRWLDGKTSWHGRDWRYLVAIAHPGLFVRRRVYQKIGAFDLRYRYSADHDFITRLIAKRCVGRFVPEPLACFRRGGLSGGSLAMFAEDETIARQYGVPTLLARLNRYRSSLGRMKQRALGRPV